MSICKICKEPIWNFLCLDCLGEDISRWLPTEQTSRFTAFHRSFVGHFITPVDATFDTCLKCRGVREAEVCSFCYLNEFMSWVNATEPDLASKLANSFVFSFERKGEFDGFFKNTRFRPVTDNRCNRETSGLCDSCGEYSEELEARDNGLLCLECREDDQD